MQNSVAKKIFAVGSAAAMLLALVAPALAQANGADAPGTNFLDPSGTVWMVTSSGTRRAYTSSGAFTSYGFNSWSQVVTGSAADLALPVDPAGFIPPQDGTIFCATATKGTDVAGQCAEITGGMKANFTSAAVFTGQGFSFANAISGDSSFLSSTGNVTSATQAHDPGTLVDNNGTVQLVGASGLLGIPDLNTFNSWGYSFSKVVPANAADMAMTQTGVMAVRVAGQLSPTTLASVTCTTNCTTPPPGVVSGNVSATLSSDTPAAGTLVANTSTSFPGQTGGDLAHFTFTGTGTVTQVVINRIGVSADNTFSNVYLYENNARITSPGSFSNGMVTFTNSSGLFTVTGSAEISVRVDVAPGATSGQTVGAELTSYAVASGTPMTVALSGNLFQIASVSNLATVEISGNSGNGDLTSSGANAGNAGTINAGTQNAVLWSVPISVGQRAVLFKHVSFTQIGSIPATALTDLQLYVDGAAVGSSASITNVGGQNEVVFDMTSNPVTLNTGGHTLALQGNVVAGTSFTYEFTLQIAADAVFTDTNYNANVPMTYSNGSTILQLTPGLTTISSGTVSIQSDPAFTATQFVSNSSGVVLGQWDLTAYGENINVNQLQVTLAYTGTATPSVEGFNNLSLYVNGGSVGSSQNALVSGTSPCSGANPVCTYTFGTVNMFTIQAGQKITLQVKGDSVLNSGTSVSAVQASLVTPDNAFQGQTSYTLSPNSPQTYTANTLTTGGTTANLYKNTGYTNQSVSSNQTAALIGSYTIQTGSIEGLRLNNLTVTATGTLDTNNVTQGITTLYITVVPGSNATGTSPTFTAQPVNPSSSNTFTVNNVTIPVSSNSVVDVYANIGNFTGTIITGLSGTGQGATSNQSVTLSSQTGQTITVSNGSITSGNVSLYSSSPVASFVIACNAAVSGSCTSQPMATFNFVASTGGATISELDFSASSTVAGAITSVTVAGVTSPVTGASSTVTGLSIPVSSSYGGTQVPVTVTFAPVGQNGIASNAQVQLVLNRIKYLSGSSTQYLPVGGAYGTLASSNSFDLVGSAPSIALTASNNTLVTGVTIGSIAISANAAGNIIASTVPITVSTANASTTGTLQLIDASNQELAGSATISVAANGTQNYTIVMLNADNNIAAGTTKTYNVVLPTVVPVTSANNYSISVGMGNASLFTFDDVNGGVNSIPGAVGGVTYIVNYPTNTMTAQQ